MDWPLLPVTPATPSSLFLPGGGGGVPALAAPAPRRAPLNLCSNVSPSRGLRQPPCSCSGSLRLYFSFPTAMITFTAVTAARTFIFLKYESLSVLRTGASAPADSGACLGLACGRGMRQVLDAARALPRDPRVTAPTVTAAPSHFGVGGALPVMSCLSPHGDPIDVPILKMTKRKQREVRGPAGDHTAGRKWW